LLVLKVTAFRSAPKSTLYTSEQSKVELMNIYKECMSGWPSDTRNRFIKTQYGKVHLLECGNEEDPPLVLLHAASMGAHSWTENLPPLLGHYHIFSIDNPGEGNKSELNDVLVFPSTPKEVADLYATLLDTLHVDSAILFGASNGGFIAQNLAFYHPEKVSRMVLFGPMGLTRLTNGSVAMMGLATIYPFQWIRNIVTDWALGTAPVCHKKYGAWFNTIMKGTIPSIAHPVPMTTTQKQQMDLPVLLFLGSNDKIVGDAETARKTALDYPDIQIEILDSGHLIAVEKQNSVNASISKFLGL
jgi:pimeloyl-ACP methyl ester carboxylesterase